MFRKNRQAVACAILLLPTILATAVISVHAGAPPKQRRANAPQSIRLKVIKTARLAAAKRMGTAWAAKATYIVHRDGTEWSIIACQVTRAKNGELYYSQQRVLMYESYEGKFLSYPDCNM